MPNSSPELRLLGFGSKRRSIECPMESGSSEKPILGAPPKLEIIKPGKWIVDQLPITREIAQWTGQLTMGARCTDMLRVRLPGYSQSDPTTPSEPVSVSAALTRCQERWYVRYLGSYGILGWCIRTASSSISAMATPSSNSKYVLKHIHPCLPHVKPNHQSECLRGLHAIHVRREAFAFECKSG